MVRTLTVWLLYCLCTDIYIVTFGSIELWYSKLFWLTYCSVLVGHTIGTIYTGFKSDTHKILTCVSLFSLMLNLILVFSYHVFGMVDYKWNFCIFNGIQVITAIFVYLSGKKRGLFINET